MRRFMGLDFAVEQVPDATTLLHFRHLLEKHQLGEKLFEAQNQIFEEEGWIMRGEATRCRAAVARRCRRPRRPGAHLPAGQRRHHHRGRDQGDPGEQPEPARADDTPGP